MIKFLEKINNIVLDSRKAKKGDLFIATKGYHCNSHQFIPQMLNQETYVLADRSEIQFQHPLLKTVKSAQSLIPFIAKAFYQHPDQNLCVIGITGTNGKTSSSHIIQKILNHHGKKTGVIGTIHNDIGGKILPAMNTTPNALELYFLLSEMVKRKCEYVCIEISSHALKLERVKYLGLDAVLYTNITQDHLDFHSDFEDYFRSKLKIFNHLKDKKKAIISLYSETQRFNDICTYLQSQTISFKTYGRHKKTDFQMLNCKIDKHRSSMNVLEKQTQKTYSIHTNLLGEFGLINILGSISLLRQFNIPITNIQKTLVDLYIPGRFESIVIPKKPLVIVDYAHTPDALDNLLQSVQKICTGKLICVFGAGGDRDRSKRPLMARAAIQYCHTVVITSDNPRTESPISIIEDIITGLSSHHRFIKEVSREKAIQQAILLCQSEEDIVVITGKGHETYQIFKDHTIPFNDKKIATQYLIGL